MAVNDKDPTEAILLVEQTIGTFNQIVVGQEGQMVPVPGYPDQPTLAERVKQNLKPSTDAAAGFAAQASASAKAAEDSAKLASQITGLETVADAIGMAALPLPAVWAPLSDSLRMITGYGRDVLVGSDVVARMVNFSRSTTKTYRAKDGALKVAAVNEPAFEAEGLLNELQSSNLITTSASFQAALPGVTYEQVVTPAFPHPITRVIKPSGDGDVRTISAELIAGTVYTASMYFDQNATPSAKVFYGTSSIAATMVRSGVVVGGLERYTATFTCQASGAHQIRFGAYAAAFDFVAGCPQIEPLPFASSYIQTAGAAVTRAPDAAYLPAAGNRFAFQGFTVAFEWDLLGVSDRIADNRLIDLDNDASSNRHYVGVSQERRLVAMFGTNKIVSQSAVMSGLCVLVVNGSSFSLYNNGAKIGTATVTGRAEAANAKLYLLCNNTGLFQSAGHMRNLRIWHRALSEAQIKAIA